MQQAPCPVEAPCRSGRRRGRRVFLTRDRGQFCQNDPLACGVPSTAANFQRRRDFTGGYASVYAGPYPSAPDEPALTLPELQEKSIEELRETAGVHH